MLSFSCDHRSGSQRLVPLQTFRLVRYDFIACNRSKHINQPRINHTGLMYGIPDYRRENRGEAGPFKSGTAHI